MLCTVDLKSSTRQFFKRSSTSMHLASLGMGRLTSSDVQINYLNYTLTPIVKQLANDRRWHPSRPFWFLNSTTVHAIHADRTFSDGSELLPNRGRPSWTSRSRSYNNPKIPGILGAFQVRRTTLLHITRNTSPTSRWSAAIYTSRFILPLVFVSNLARRILSVVA